MHSLTYTEENYLKAIYSIQENNGQGQVSVNEIADKMHTRPATVTDMIKKLSEKALIHYEKYRKIELSEEGKKIALTILRKHRLWETFLSKKLHFSWDEVHEVAEQLEHIQSEKLIDKLDEFLGFPEYDPHGDPIPKHNGEIPEFLSVPLSEAEIGESYKFVGVKDTSTAFLQHLQRHGLEMGITLKLTERLPFDNSVDIELEDGSNHHLSEKIAENILVI